MFIGDFYWNLPSSFPSLTVTSVYYIIFVFVTFLISRIHKSFARPLALLVMNVVFLLSFSFVNFAVAFLLSMFGYLFAFLISNSKNKKNAYIGIAFYALILIFFKYHGLLNINNIIMPLGLSFYTFKIISYILDVNSGKCKLQKNIIYYFDYVLFFPTITAGPINRANPFFDELKSKPEFDYNEAKSGAFQMMLGIFEKKVFCDYIALISNGIFQNDKLYGLNMIVGIILYSFQIYLDFDSISNIAIGTSKLLGFKITKNFNSPYLASNLQSFWRRWHISLSTWFRDYLYIPLGGSRKGNVRKYLNIIIVFIVSGLWHGSTLNFLIWGLFHGVLQVVEDLILKNFRGNECNKKLKMIIHFLGIMFNFIIVSFLWLIFKCSTLEETMMVINRVLISQNLDLNLIGINTNEIIWLITIIFIVIVMDILRDKIDVIDWFNSRCFVFRWFAYFVLLLVFIVFGVYGGSFDSSDFIYQFF